VASTLVDPVAFGNLDWGVPLSATEAAEMARRGELVSELGPARQFAADQADYAGSYFDNLAGGIPVFMFTGDPELHRADLIASLPPKTEFRIEQAARTMVEIEKTRASIDAAWDTLKRNGLDIRLTGLDDVRNGVVVGVGSDTDTAASALAQFGDGIFVRREGAIEPDACVDRTNCGSPMKGGIQITYTSTRWCTSGFMGKVRNSNPIGLRVLTAGHCIELNGGVGASWYQHGVRIGAADMERWYNGTTADIGSIATGEPGDKNTFYASSATDIRHVSGFEPVNSQLIGDTVCRGGAKTGYLCGSIHLRDVTRDVDGKSVQHSWEVDFDASPGDSGAPYFLGNTAYGIHTDSTTDSEPQPRYAWYSPIGWILSEASVSLCISTSCS
jgi:hypothetical protein